MADQFESDPSNFQDEISKMMYGFGDSSSPNPDAVILVESVVKKHLQSLVQEANQISIERNRKNITNYELIYLLNRNKNVLKLKRLHDLQIDQEKFEQMDDIQLLSELVGDEQVYCDKKSLARRRKRRTHIKIIRSLDKTVDKVNHDYLGHLRKLRAMKVSNSVPKGQYKPYQEARCITFRVNKDYQHDLVKLRRWIDPDRTYKITYSALEVLCFIAFENVGEIVEAIHLCRQEKVIGHNCGFMSMQLDNGVYIQWPITVSEVNEALTKYFTPSGWLNALFFKNMGLDYLTAYAGLD